MVVREGGVCVVCGTVSQVPGTRAHPFRVSTTHTQRGSQVKDCCCYRVVLVGDGFIWMLTTTSPKSESCTG